METDSTFFNQKILDHFTHPRNIGEIENPDGYARIGDPNCGDYIKVWIRVKDETIVDFKYKVFGCWGAISTTSVVSELAIGKTLRQASHLSDDDVIKALGGIPENKQHCSLLGIQGLRAAIADFLVKDNHGKYTERIELYRAHGYDIPGLRKQLVRYVNDLSNDASILEVGTGKGHLALAIAATGRRCTSIDISSEEIYYARLNAIYFGVYDLIDFQVQDARQLSFANEAFDAILSAALFHHLLHPELVLNEMVRVCKGSGRIVISDLNDRGQQIMALVHRNEGKEHVRVGWTIEQIAKWFKYKGFKYTKYSENCEDILVVNMKNNVVEV